MVSNTPWALRVHNTCIEVIDANGDVQVYVTLPTNQPNTARIDELVALGTTLVRLANTQPACVSLRTSQTGAVAFWDEVPDPNVEPHQYGQHCECPDCV